MASLEVVPYRLVSATSDFDRVFNTNNHTHQEISSVLPDITHHPSPPQPWILLSPFLDLIASSQGLSLSSIHRITLPPSFLISLLHASQTALILGRISDSDVEDLTSTFPSTTDRGDDLASVLRSGKYFARLDTCSLKDCILGASGEIKNAQDLWTRLTTSSRAVRSIQDLRDENIQVRIILYLLPWNENIQTKYEYRVFCPPNTGKVSAISQYAWHSPWHLSHLTSHEQHDTAERLITQCQILREKIMTHPSMTEEVAMRGFVFDVFQDRVTKAVKLLELNGFGAMTGSGSCLFHWIRDAKVLYGEAGGKADLGEVEEERIAVRVTF